GVNVVHRQADGPLVDFALGGDDRIALVNQSDVAARAAHVEGNDVLDADALARAHGGDDAARGTGENRGDRLFGRAVEGRYTTVGLHDIELRRRHADLFEPVSEPAQVIRHHGSDIGIDHRRAHSIELADLRQHLAGEREARFGKFLGEDLFYF